MISRNRFTSSEESHISKWERRWSRCDKSCHPFGCAISTCEHIRRLWRLLSEGMISPIRNRRDSVTRRIPFLLHSKAPLSVAVLYHHSFENWIIPSHSSWSIWGCSLLWRVMPTQYPDWNELYMNVFIQKIHYMSKLRRLIMKLFWLYETLFHNNYTSISQES